MMDWRGKPVPKRAPPVRPAVNRVTGRPICVRCSAPIDHLSSEARFCSHGCRSKYHAALAYEASKVAQSGRAAVVASEEAG